MTNEKTTDSAASALSAGLGARPINCDQVAWMLNAIGRYLPRTDHPAVSRAREMQKYALLYELMEVAYLHFEDAAAKYNGTPPDVMRFQCASKLAEHEAQQGNICKAPNVEMTGAARLHRAASRERSERGRSQG